MDADVPEVLFVCVENAGRSQVAAALLDAKADGHVRVRSAGSEPAERVNPNVIDALAEAGLDVSKEFPKPITDDAVQAADVVITMGCGDACPVYPGKRYEDWELDDPSGEDLDGVRRIRDEIDARVTRLLDEIAPGSAIELDDLVKKFGSELVLKGVDLAVPQGAITVLLGPSGAGKTVTISHVFGLIQPTAGVVRVEGKDLAALSEDELYALRRRMSAVLQGTLPFTCGLFYSLNVYENVAFALRARNTRWSEEQVHRVTMDHLGMVGLRDRAGDMPDVLSAGMSKRVALARALALDARIVVIDDFDSGIDGVRLALLCELIRDMQRRTGATYLVTTHDMTAARELADHVAVIHDGRIAATGTADSVFDSSDPLVHQLVSGELSGPLELRAE